MGKYMALRWQLQQQTAEWQRKSWHEVAETLRVDSATGEVCIPSAVEHVKTYVLIRKVRADRISLCKHGNALTRRPKQSWMGGQTSKRSVSSGMVAILA